MKPATYLPSLLALCALLLSACGGSSSPKDERTPGNTLTIYASMPRQGATARMADEVAAGARLALADADGHAGGKQVRLIELDSSRPDGDTWDPSTVQENANRAADDPTAIAYIGELGEGASAISLPVTNDKGILQISPADGLTSLTRQEPGASLATSPERYYPSGKRTFLRLVPTDFLQAGTLVSWARSRGARQLAVVADERLFGRELAHQVVYAASKLGMTVPEAEEAGNDPAGYPALARKLATARPDAVIYTGLGDADSGPLLAAVARILPGIPIYAGSGLATAQPLPAGLPAVSALKPPLGVRAYGPKARRLLARLARQRGAPVGPEALYGYEAMRVVLDAIRAAGPDAGDRAAVAREALTPRVRRSALGDYRVLPGGDVSTLRFGAYRRGRSTFLYEGPRLPPATLK
jgi:branched-chain amino acid transport system substrate-binding protein